MGFMKSSKLSNVIGMAALALSLSLVPSVLPAAAQTQDNNNPTTDIQNNNAPNLDTTPFQETRGKVDNYGWLGVFGMLGLLNLLRKPKAPTAYEEPDMAARSGSSYRD
jgi:hypothetical protein